MTLIRARLSTPLLYLVLLPLCAFVVFPFLWLALTSLKPDAEMFSIPPRWLPSHVTFGHYLDVLAGNFGLFLRNSLIVAVVSTALAMALGLPAAFGFARYRYRLSGVLFAAIVAARMFPPVTLIIPYFMAMRTTGLINTPVALIATYVPLELPLIIWILEGFFRELPREIEEAAEMDGLSTLGILLRVAVPLSVPAIGVAVMFGFLQSWNEFIFALTLTQTPDAQTVPVGIAGYITSFQTFWGQMAAAAVLYSIPAIVVTALAQCGLVRGLMVGAVKG